MFGNEPSALSPWFPRSAAQREPAVRLFCFPYAGGSAVIYHQWASDMDRSVEVTPAQLPGRSSRIREAAFQRLDPLADALADAIAPRLDRPFALFGHSLGAVLAFEIARKLRARGQPAPAGLFVSARRAPHIPPRRPPIHNLGDSDFIAELRALNGTPETVLREPDLLQLMLPTLRADFAAIETYVYRSEAPLDCPIVALGGLADRISREDLDAWRAETRGGFTLRMFPGDHFFLHGAGPAVARAVSGELLRLLV